MRPVLQAIAILYVLVCAACSKDSPTSPTPNPGSPPVASAAPATPDASADLDEVSGTARVSWLSSADATTYVISHDAVGGQQRQVEVQSPGRSGVALTAVLTDLLLDVPEAKILVTAKNAAGSSGPKVIEFYLPAMSSVIEGLFLGSGPYAQRDVFEEEGYSGRMVGWMTSGNVRIRAHSSLEPVRDVIADFAGDLSALTGNYLHGQLDEIGPIEDIFVKGEVRLFTSEAPCGNLLGPNCADYRIFPPVGGPSSWNASNVYVQPNPWRFLVNHEMAHALLGLRHLNSRPWGPGINRPVMMIGPLAGNWTASGHVSDLEKEAVRRVYLAGLRPGAVRADFAARGLVD